MSMDTFTIDGIEYHPTVEQWRAIDAAKHDYIEDCRRIDAERKRRQAGGPLILDDDFRESRKAHTLLCDRIREIFAPAQENV